MKDHETDPLCVQGKASPLHGEENIFLLGCHVGPGPPRTCWELLPRSDIFYDDICGWTHLLIGMDVSASAPILSYGIK